ncbi:MAG: GspH/FimT family pseudopilin [Thiogranum sp.]
MKKERGFTLIELMVALAVAAILLTTGIPAMRDFIRDNRLTAATNTFVSTLNIARSEAITQGRSASVCVSSNQTNCSGSNWQSGWIVWVDSDGDGGFDANEVLRVVEPLPATVSATLSSGQSSFSVDAQGAVSNPNFTLTLCDDRSGETGRQLRIMATGGVSLNSQFGCS